MAVGIGGAFAYIQATGTGNGKVSAGTVQPVTLKGTSAIPLTPNGVSQQLAITYTNPNSFPVKAQNGITLTIDPASLPAQCTASEFHVTAVVGPITLVENKTTDTALIAHDGGTIVWDETDTNQLPCLNALGSGITVDLVVA
jgi:hypothetical protein